MDTNDNLSSISLRDLLHLQNGRKPSYTENMEGYPVYGANGRIGVSADKNSIRPLIVIGRVGSYCGNVYFIDEDCWVTDNAIIAKSVNGDEIYFVYYLLKLLKLNKYRGGSGQPLLNHDIIYSIKANVPSKFSLRMSIGKILNLLDSKIELNHQMNSTLESLARALFHSWFVRFEPFQRGEFKETELGLIPKSWKIIKFTESFNIGGGGTPKTSIRKYWDGEIMWATGKDISQNSGVFLFNTEKKITKSGLDESSARIYPKSTTVITARGTVGKLKLLGSNIAISQTCYAITPKKQNYPYFLYLLVSDMVKNLKHRAYGAIFDTITSRTFDSYKIIFPSDVILEKFSKLIKPLFEKTNRNSCEIFFLSSLRDLLLPQLLSGKLRIKDPERFLEELKQFN